MRTNESEKKKRQILLLQLRFATQILLQTPGGVLHKTGLTKAIENIFYIVHALYTMGNSRRSPGAWRSA